MDEQTKQRLLEKNQKLIAMVIERAKRDFPDDIALIGLSGSFSTNDFHEKSDLDLIIINNTERGWEISRSFILDDVGYDIYCTPWDTRIQEESELSSPGVSCLIDLQILYYSTEADLERFQRCRQRALDLLAKPMGPEAVARAAKSLAGAKQAYADTVLGESIGEVRSASARLLLDLVNALTHLNNTYIHRGIKRYLEELSAYQNLPENFEDLFTGVLLAETVGDIRARSHALLKAVLSLYEKIKAEYAPPPVPDQDRLRGTYEELWCNCRNKVLKSAESGNPVYFFFAAAAAQDYLDEMAQEVAGTPKFDLMQYYDPKDPGVFKREFLRVMDEYLEEYNRAGLAVERYDTFEELYAAFMGEGREQE